MEIDQKELEFLEMVKSQVGKQIENTENANKTLLESMKENMSYMWNSIYEIDNAEKSFIKNQMELLDDTQKENLKELMSYKASLKSPYFAKVDFDSREEGFLSYHIGLKGIKNGTTVYVVDWRAPFSELYYNYDVGPAEYKVELGKVTGEIKDKYQYKIEDGNMVFCIKSNIKIDDSVLQEVLAKTASEKMKNIVSTIQREQNEIIRKETQSNLFVQGVAGSGKTSIALHRIAYMLYKNRKTLNSNSVLIISPNKFFSDYISNVLPELGEENVAETVMDQILKEELEIKEKIETKSEQVERLLGDQFEVKFCEIKNGFQFCEDISSFCEHFFEENFIPQDIIFQDFLICSKEKLHELYSEKYKNRPVFMKLDWIKDYIYEESKQFDVKLPKSTISKMLKSMLKVNNIFDAYSHFLSSYYSLDFIYKPKIKFEDAVALLYIKQYLYGYNTFSSIKHLLIDEFQDYSPLNFKIISKMFPCPKTILGDINQDVSGSKTKILENLNKIDDRTSELIQLTKSYRSSYEIASFTNMIIGRTNADIVDRHGDDVEIEKYYGDKQKIDIIVNTIKRYQEKNHKTIGILTKSIKQSLELDKLLRGKLHYDLLSTETTSYSDGVMLAPTFLVKGLEFDSVIVVDTDTENFATEIDKQALYVACTRAMHNLTLVYTHDLTKFID